MSFWGGLGKVLGVAGGAIAAPFTGGASLAAILPAVLGAGGAAAGAIADSKANNRGAQYSGQLDLEKLLMARDQQFQNQQIQREQEGRAGTTDAYRKLLSAQHIGTPSAQPHLSPYSVAPRQATAPELQGADALTQQVLARLQGGNPIPEVAQRPLAVDPKLLQAGGGEQTAGWLSAILSGLGGVAGAQRPPYVMSGIPPNGAPRG